MDQAAQATSLFPSRSANRSDTMRDHALLVGYGAGGRRVADALRSLRVAVVVVEIDPGLAAQAAAAGHSVVHGDARRGDVLMAANAPVSSFVAITMSNLDEGLVHAIRRVKPEGVILTHFPKGFTEPGVADVTAAMLARVTRLVRESASPNHVA